MRVFETWNSIPQMKDLSQNVSQNGTFTLANLPAASSDLKSPGQFRSISKSCKDNSNLFVDVRYNPQAAMHAITEKLFFLSTMMNFQKAGMKRIPDFPSEAITIKPAYIVLSSVNQFGPARDSVYKVPVWPGPPPAPGDTICFPTQDWNNDVFVYTGKKPANAKSNYYSVTDFIRFQLDGGEVKRIRGQQKTAKVGDYAILMGCHVATRENTRWTWQTFWWSKNPDNPHKPSTRTIVAARPKELKDVPRNYAMAIGYSMILPAQPVNGGTNQGTSVYCYNPYLEAPFGHSTFVEASEVPGAGQGKPVVRNFVGTRTNCMTCHSLANFNPHNPTVLNKPPRNQNPQFLPGYMANRYFSLDEPFFQDRITVDLLWTIPPNLDDNQ